ncbi:MAG: PD-(D/E)XK nuclease family protein [bacterium]
MSERAMERRIRRDLADLLGEPEFLRVDGELREPNIFSILGTEEMSSSINAFLAWLLNPNASHGLEDAFLRAFLVEAIKNPPPDRGNFPEGISPIPYEAVGETVLDWDLMDVRCADLRETIATTEFHLSASDAKVDICLYNDSYAFAVYVENRLAPRDAWRQSHASLGRPWEYRTQEYLLDLYHQWATEQAGEYSILPVFMSLDEQPSQETRFFHTLGYAWMHDVLKGLAKTPTASEHARILLNDFCRWLRREIPDQLDPYGLQADLDSLAEKHGLVISRLFDHVAECMACDEDDLTEAFHEVYRRYRPTIDTLWRFLLFREDDRVAATCAEVEQRLTGQDGIVLLVLPNRLAATSPRWIAVGGEEGQPAMEVYASTTAMSCGVLAYTRLLGTASEKIWRTATDLAESRGEKIASERHAKLNFHLVKTLYNDFVPARVADDFVRHCRFLNELFS